jgi:multicomponent Na+:H+ antiporter subunit B
MNDFYNFLVSLNLPNNIGFSTDLMILNSFGCFLIFVIFKVIRTKDNLSLVIFSSLISILLVVLYLAMDAPDVAMTEASVNVCLATLISLAAIKKIKQEQENSVNIVPAFLLCLTIAVFFIYISMDLKEFGASWAPIHYEVGKYYIENTMQDIGIESIVCAILASYRGFDTMGETAVIASAAISVLYILSLNNEKEKNV